MERIPSAELLPDYENWNQRIDKAIDTGEAIRVIGDYDVDGIMSTVILVQALRRCGANVDYRVPHRIEDGYGINVAMVDEAHAAGIRLLITCDNGIRAFEAAERARELGVDLLITDHHEPQQVEGRDLLPLAAAVIDAKRADSRYPFRELCGAGLAYKLMLDLLRRRGVDDPALERELIACAGVATVCDIVDLTDENRVYVREGMRALSQSKQPGWNALMEVADVRRDAIDTYILGFALGPRLNSGGRLESAALGIELLLAEDPCRAMEIARTLDALNTERKRLTEDGVSRVLEQLGDQPLPPFIIEYIGDVHESVAGIIAGRIKERFYRPTIILTDAKEGVKGSGRSIEGVDILSLLAPHEKHFKTFGGHTMACGLSLEKENVEPFLQAFYAALRISEDALKRKVYVDMLYPIEFAGPSLVDMIDDFRPFGKGNPEPKFADRGLRLVSFKALGQKKNVLKLTLETQSGVLKTATLFQTLDQFVERASESGFDVYEDRPEGGGKLYLDIVYFPKYNTFRGETSVELIVSHYRFVKGGE